MNDDSNKPNAMEAVPGATRTAPKCPHCKEPYEAFQVTIIGNTAIFWHEACNTIINCQLLSLPQERPRIIPPFQSMGPIRSH